MRFGYLCNFGITSSPTHHYQYDDVGNRTSVLGGVAHSALLGAREVVESTREQSLIDGIGELLIEVDNEIFF